MKLRHSLVLFTLALASPSWAEPAATQPNASFYLVNKGSVAIDHVFATPVGLPNWGQDRLSSASIQPGANFAVRLPADGTCKYDIRVTYAGGRNEDKRNVDTCHIDNISFPGGRVTAETGQTGGATPSQRAPNSGPTFTVVNRSRGALNEIYLSTTGDDSWGDDRLGDDTLAAGGSKAVHLPAGSCMYDIRVVFANGDAYEKRRLNVCQMNSIRLP